MKHLKLIDIFALLGLIPLAAQTAPTPPTCTGAPHSVFTTWSYVQPSGTDPATGFQVLKAATANSASVVIATINDPTVQSYTDTNVCAGQTPVYTVVSINPGGTSTTSNTLTCVIPFSAPGPPTNLQGKAQ